MKRVSKPRPATLLTWLAALAVAGGLAKLALDDEIVEFALPEPAPPSAAKPPAFEAALSPAPASRQ